MATRSTRPIDLFLSSFLYDSHWGPNLWMYVLQHLPMLQLSNAHQGPEEAFSVVRGVQNTPNAVC